MSRVSLVSLSPMSSASNLNFSESLFQFLCAARDQDEVGALGCQLAGCTEPHSLRGSSYENGLCPVSAEGRTMKPSGRCTHLALDGHLILGKETHCNGD